MVGKEHRAGSLWTRPLTVGPGCLFALLWRSPVVQRELGAFRMGLELSFLVGRDRPSRAKLLRNKPSCVTPQHLCVLSMQLVGAQLAHSRLAQLFHLDELMGSISNPQAHNWLLLCSRHCQAPQGHQESKSVKEQD